MFGGHCPINLRRERFIKFSKNHKNIFTRFEAIELKNCDSMDNPTSDALILANALVESKIPFP